MGSRPPVSGLLQGFQAFLFRPQRAHRSASSAVQGRISTLAARHPRQQLPDSVSSSDSRCQFPLSIPIKQAYISIRMGRRVQFDSLAVCMGTLKQEVYKGLQWQRSRLPAPDSYDDRIRQIPDVTSFAMPHPDRIRGLSRYRDTIAS